MTSPRVVLIFNPDAGGSRRQHPPRLLPPSPNTDWLDDALVYLRERGTTVEPIATRLPGDATRIARDAAGAGVDLVIAAGGDGTLRSVVDGLAGTGVPLGIIPRGTVNVLARELGIPLNDPLAACDLCLKPHSRRIDLGRLPDGRHFLLMCSAGFDAAAVGSVNVDIKGFVGAPAYVLSGLATLATYIPCEFEITLDGAVRAPMSAFMIVVANAPAYGGDFRVAPLADIGDGLLDICVFTAPPGLPPVQKAAFLRQVGSVALQRTAQDPDIQYFRARRIEIVARPDVPTQIDGDALGTTPLVIDVAPGALLVKTLV